MCILPLESKLQALHTHLLQEMTGSALFEVNAVTTIQNSFLYKRGNGPQQVLETINFPTTTKIIMPMAHEFTILSLT